MAKPSVNICWFRRDLRLEDNAALYHALRDTLPVVPVFIFDRYILDELEDKKDRRVHFIHRAVTEMNEALASRGSAMEVYYGFPEEIFKALFDKYQIEKIFANEDYEPYAIERDAKIGKLARAENASFHTYKDQVIFSKDEILKDDGSPYSVFSPYARKWLATVNAFYLSSYPINKYAEHFFKQSPKQLPGLRAMGFENTTDDFPPQETSAALLRHYREKRNFPAADGTSRLSVHLRFGTVSIRELARRASKFSDTFLNELIWRDFYQMILWHFPQVGKGKAFKPEYDRIEWRNSDEEFDRWTKGLTGYPIVDAGMRQLNETGYMHNRVRMIVASFLTKHLLIDWRWGEDYFARKLLDFDLASNNGGWQWASGSGCDAAPFFRIFNPYLQTKKFDPDLEYINKWVPEFQEFSYPAPIVEHEFARARCLEVYGRAVGKDAVRLSAKKK